MLSKYTENSNLGLLRNAELVIKTEDTCKDLWITGLHRMKVIGTGNIHSKAHFIETEMLHYTPLFNFWRILL